MTERKLMKEGLDKNAVSRLSSSLTRVFPDFPEIKFQLKAFEGLDKLELKQRVEHLIEVLHEFLPQDFCETATQLQQLPLFWDAGNPDDPLNGFAAWPVIDYIAHYGLEETDLSLETLKTLTPLFSAEFAIRPFLLHHPETCFYHMVRWVEDHSEHVRRLVSEGTRPRLPWGQQLKPFIENPEDVLSLLNLLTDDRSEYVRRSVANNLNDIAKDHPYKVIEFCTQLKKNPSPEKEWIIRHATRTLVKNGLPEVFDLLGYTQDPQIDINALLLDSQQILLGQTLSFTFDISSTSDQPQKIVIDYAVHFVKANGKLSPKVFKLKNLELAPRQRQKIVKSHSFKKITTRTYYEGEHVIEIFINGTPKHRKTFMLYP